MQSFSEYLDCSLFINGVFVNKMSYVVPYFSIGLLMYRHGSYFIDLYFLYEYLNGYV